LPQELRPRFSLSCQRKAAAPGGKETAFPVAKCAVAHFAGRGSSETVPAKMRASLLPDALYLLSCGGAIPHQVMPVKFGVLIEQN